MKKNTVKISLDPNHRAVVDHEGNAWKLKRKSQEKGAKRKWVTMGSGKISNDDPELKAMISAAQSGTDAMALRVALCIQRATKLFGANTGNPNMILATATPAGPEA